MGAITSAIISGIAFVLLIVVLIIGWIAWQIFSGIRPKHRPKLCRRATVKGKRDDPDGSYHIGFEFMDDQKPPRKVCKVPIDDYMFLQEGNEVDVYFKDGNYHGFERN